MSPCLGIAKSFLATSTPSRKMYSWIFLRSAFGMSLWRRLVNDTPSGNGLVQIVHCCEFLALFGESHTMRNCRPAGPSNLIL